MDKEAVQLLVEEECGHRRVVKCDRTDRKVGIYRLDPKSCNYADL